MFIVFSDVVRYGAEVLIYSKDEETSFVHDRGVLCSLVRSITRTWWDSLVLTVFCSYVRYCMIQINIQVVMRCWPQLRKFGRSIQAPRLCRMRRCCHGMNFHHRLQRKGRCNMLSPPCHGILVLQQHDVNAELLSWYSKINMCSKLRIVISCLKTAVLLLWNHCCKPASDLRGRIHTTAYKCLSFSPINISTWAWPSTQRATLTTQQRFCPAECTQSCQHPSASGAMPTP